MIRASLKTQGLLVLLTFALTASGQRGRKGEMLAPTPAAARLNVSTAHEFLDDASWTAGLELRNVGPTVMSGRVVDLSVNPSEPAEFVVAYATGGLWHTRDHGTSFTPLFDHEAVIFIGAIAVDWSARTLWVGTGEVNASRSSYAGVGVYRSSDWGQSWQHMGLEESHHIGRMALTSNGDLYVASMGALYQEATPGQRGVYRWTKDSGQWDLVLDGTQANRPAAGAIDLVVDAANENHLYAALWDRTRRAWDFTEGGPASGVFESIDGGDSWVRLTTAANGFPAAEGVGRMGLAYHPGEARLYVIVDNQNAKPDEETDEADELEAKDFRTMDAAAFAALDTAALTNFLEENGFPEDADASSLFGRVADGDLDPAALADYLGDANAEMFDPPIIGAEVYRWHAQPLRAGEQAPRGIDTAAAAWVRTHEEALDEVCYSYCYYFGLIEVDPNDATHLAIGGVPLLESTDGGATWSSIAQDNVHVDHHHIWFDPADSQHMINGNDGGINVTFDGGEHWTSCNSPAVGQFYAIAVDDAKPYRIYGGLQDNGTWRGPSSYEESPRWHQTGNYPYDRLNGGDGMRIEVDTRDNETVYTGYQFGWYSRSNRKTGDRAGLHPEHTLGETPLRWNWQTPIHLSRHQQDILYMGSNRFHRSFDQGDAFETLSGDLTRGTRKGNVPFGSLTAIHESPLRFGRLAVGSDDGLIHLSPDGGYTWENRTPPAPQAAPERTLWVTEVLWSHHAPDRVFAALNGYRHDHFAPYLYASNDNGRSWSRLGDDGTVRLGLPMEPINALAESEDVEGLLFCGTDGGLYTSIDGGFTWSTAHPDLPRVPVHDLVIQERENELVIGTHGRSIWVLDIAPLIDGLTAAADAMPESLPLTMETPENLTWREGWGERGYGWGEPWTPEVKAAVFLPSAGDHVLQVLDSAQKVVSQTSYSGLERGWQHLTFTPQKVNETEFLGPGAYTLTLQSTDDNAARSETSWSIEEEED
ncbi:MAG: glycosyl hydrolase [Flavobacteriales bacterium]|nr:glycosyl hydrolase [Flavobacteriales bacterium]